MFAQRLAGHSAARITRALNDAGVPCPSAADPGRNPHRTGAAWTLRTVAAILANPRYTGRQVWNRQRHRLRPGRPGQHGARAQAGAAVEPARGLGHLPASRRTRRWSARPTSSPPRTPAPRGPAGPGGAPVPAGRAHRLRAVRARLESAWSYGRPAYRCRHGHTSAAGPDPGPAEEHLRPRGPDPAAPGRPRHPPTGSMTLSGR
jgi:site-specific DNA recombinase